MKKLFPPATTRVVNVTTDFWQMEEQYKNRSEFLQKQKWLQNNTRCLAHSTEKMQGSKENEQASTLPIVHRESLLLLSSALSDCIFIDVPELALDLLGFWVAAMFKGGFRDWMYRCSTLSLALLSVEGGRR